MAPASDSRSQAAEVARSRAAVYAFFAAQVLEPPVRADQSRDALIERWRDFGDATDVSGVGALLDALSSSQATAEALNESFSLLFVVPTGRYLAPIESVYREATREEDTWTLGMLRGKPWAAVTARYADAGFEVDRQRGIEADHLGCELQFLSTLCGAEADALRDDALDTARVHRARQLEFLTQHPLTWIDRLRARLADVSAGSFYDHVLGVLGCYLAMERDYLGEAETPA